MNLALPALVVFVLLLPGFVARSRFKRAERTVLDYSPFGQVVTEALVWAAALHGLWLAAAATQDQRLRLDVLLRLLSSDSAGQASAITFVGARSAAVLLYLGSMLGAAYVVPTLARMAVSRLRLDRAGARFSTLFRFHGAPWYYLLTGADFDAHDVPDLISVSAIVDVAGEAFLYTGVLADFYLDPDGRLDRLVLESVMRRPLARDKEAASAPAQRFYPVDGDYFVLRYAETVTLNIQYVKLAPA